METRNCQNCKKSFLIVEEDFAFYGKINVPPPTFCPMCRFQRRMMFRNERTLYSRENNAPGKLGEQIVSIHRPGTAYTVYDDRTWWGDSWDPIEYGKDYDFSKPFFQQFKELYERIPLINLSVTNMVNCEYCNVAEGDKNGFMLSASHSNEDTMYGNRVTENKQSAEMYIANHNELCYELVNSHNNFKVQYSKNCKQCADSYFLESCVNCQNCFGCTNLRGKSYCVFNEQYTREQYLEFLSTIDLTSHSTIEEYKAKAQKFHESQIHRFANMYKSVNCTGENIENSKNLKYSFDIVGTPIGCEDGKYLVWGGYDIKDSYDSGPGVGIKGERLYDTFDSALQSQDLYFTGVVYHCFDVRYSINCHGSSHLFGCHGLRSKQYCILNKQYTKEEYEALIPKIIAHMNEMPYIDAKGRTFTYGEFFPYNLSPFAYNETVAQEYFPLSKEDALAQGFTWFDRDERNYTISIANEMIPDGSKTADASITKEIIECRNKGSEISQCTTAFRIMSEEFDLYHKMNVPLPVYCPNCRHYNRLKQRNPMKLYQRTCMCDIQSHDHSGTCANEFQTTYAPERVEKIYCEGCYQKEVL